MWWKNKFVLFSLCLQLIFLALFSCSSGVKAAEGATDGFIIEADRVVGSGMIASIIKQESATKDGKPMLRFYYKSATIYGMRLTKQVETPKGAISITLKAKGPVTVKGMTVDTTAISFKGACVKASETVPELGMEHVVMVAHFMNTMDSDIKSLVLNTISGKSDTPMPKKLKLLQDLSLLPSNELGKEMERIASGHLPLLCEDGAKNDQANEIGSIMDPLKEVIDSVTNPLESVKEPLDQVKKPLEPVLKPLDPMLKPLEPVLKPLEPGLKPLDPVTKQIDPILKPLEPPTEQVVLTIQSTCERIKSANGVISKELAIDLINEAIENKVSLTSVCQSDRKLTTELQKWETAWLNSLGLLNPLGKLIPLDPNQQLYKMRETIAKENDGTIIYKP